MVKTDRNQIWINISTAPNRRQAASNYCYSLNEYSKRQWGLVVGANCPFSYEYIHITLHKVRLLFQQLFHSENCQAFLPHSTLLTTSVMTRVSWYLNIWWNDSKDCLLSESCQTQWWANMIIWRASINHSKHDVNLKSIKTFRIYLKEENNASLLQWLCSKLVLFKEVTSLCTENHKKPINELC
jgi:hypothetical protein